MPLEPMRCNRGQALAEAFFFRMDQELIAILSSRMKRDETIQLMADATGMQDRDKVEQLLEAGFDLSTLTAFLWAPLVFVAWSDGKADNLEREAILESLTAKGIPWNTANLLLAHRWFKQDPTEDLWPIWTQFAERYMASLSQESRSDLIDEIVDRCYVVARASGGFLGVGKVSPAETEMIDRILRALGQLEDVPQN